MSSQTDTLDLTKPGIGSTGWGEEVNDNWDKIEDLPDSITTPLWMNMLTDEPDSAGQGSWAVSHDNSYLYLGYLANTSGADGDEFSCVFRCAEGTYKLRLNAPKGADCGVVDVEVDGVEKGSFDLYAASADKLNVEEIAGLELAPREHILTFRLDGKNASSSGYLLRCSGISLQRTG